MFATVRDLKAAFTLLPLSAAGAVLPALITIPFDLAGKMFNNPETPATFSGNTVTPLGIVVGFVAWTVLAMTQFIPWYYMHRYNQIQQDSPGQSVFGLSPRVFLILGAIVYFGSCLGMVAIMTLSG